MKYKIIVDKQSRTNPSSEKKEYEIDIEELRTRRNVYDSIVITREESYVLRKLALSDLMVLSELPEPIKEPLNDIKIQLFEGDNYIYLIDMTGNKFYAEYLIKNEFNDLYVTLNQMNSAINQSASQIELTVNQKLEGYSTTEEMNAAITVKANEINSEVSKKVGNDEIISKINQSAEAITINADKIDINGKAVRFKTDILKNVGPFTEEDNEKVKNYIMGTGTLTSEEFTKYDISGDGKINTLDWMYIGQAVANGGYRTFSGSFEIDPYSSNKAITVYSNNKKRYTSIMSLLYNYFDSLYVDNINVKGINVTLDDIPGKMVVQNYDDVFTLYVDGDIRSDKKIYCATLEQTSLKDKKKNIKKLNVNATELIKNADICLYNLKGEKAKSKKHIGLVIGEGYNCPEEVISEDGQGVEQYSMTSLIWKAFQEQQEVIEKLDKRIEQLEKEVANGKN